MIGLLKMFGKGILYVIGFPFFVLALLLFGVIGIFLFVFQLVKSIFYFFTGRKFFPELPEDKELRLLKEKAAAKAEEGEEESPISEASNPTQPVNYQEPTPAPRPAYTETPVTREPLQRQEEPEQGSIEKAVFYDLRDESPVQHYEPEEDEIEDEEEPILETVNEDEEDDDFDDAIEDKSEQEAPVQRQETIQEEEVLVREETIETSTPEEDNIDDEDLEEYVPKGSSYYDEDEEEDTGSGVSIDYDVR